ncbi:putative lipid-binding protein AIR1 [Dioscorea cayenensis subsp. rotundata]|uniref:Lipid-binding protein AIR1 n=1 Tax=Dioscorea cayennensis subsp. rotundata TaxID=55577 RepID=A0AB40CMJ5_DIOCR|nr:putative lipid-binding protein AIR1 [Dioscorea cayenensis subsp. rotundata]
MASKPSVSKSLLLLFNLIFFTFLSSTTATNCPIDALKLGVCVDLLQGLLSLRIPSKEGCCPLINGLADLDAAACLCTTIKVNLLNVINLTLPIDLSLLLNYCSGNAASGFKCS